MKRLRLLMTNNTLAARAGTELYVRDLAAALVRRGHQVTAYSPLLGEVAHELRKDTVAVTDDLGPLEQAPDLIHGQHHLETMTALQRYPRVPAIYVCHGWLPWEEAPPLHPRIRRYVAVDEVCRDRLVLEAGIPETRIRLLLNFVDLARFRPRDPLPERPRRALVFSNPARERPYLEALRAACAAEGISLDVVGAGSGNATSKPERVLPSYDLVFAKARAALEAMAVGAAVVLWNEDRMGPMVTADGFDALRPLNFGVRTLAEDVLPDRLIREIRRYDPADARKVADKVRACAGLDAAADAILELYREVLSEAAPAACGTEESLSTASYLRRLSSRLKGYEDARRDAENLDRLVHATSRELARARAEADALRTEAGALREEVGWMRRSMTFRVRRALLAVPGVAPLARTLARLRTAPPDRAATE